MLFLLIVVGAGAEVHTSPTGTQRPAFHSGSHAGSMESSSTVKLLSSLKADNAELIAQNAELKHEIALEEENSELTNDISQMQDKLSQIERILERSHEETQLRVLQYNLGWETMAGMNVGTGKFASQACVNYNFAIPDDDASIERIRESKQSKDRSDNYVSSCTINLFEKLKEWITYDGEKWSYGLVTFSELCNPNEDVIVPEDQKQNVPRKELKFIKFKKQCSPKMYKKLLHFFRGYDAILGGMTGAFGPVHQLTFYDKAQFPGKTCDASFDMIPEGSQKGRPVTVIVFEKVMVLNVHSVHFRKMLIADANSVPANSGLLIQLHKLEIVQFEVPPNYDFAIENFNTAQLQKAYGDFLTKRITAALKDCETFEPSLERIIASGDFNDETGELYEFKLFSKTVKIAKDKRLRTCCSDRDEYWIKPYKKWEAAKTPFWEIVTETPESTFEDYTDDSYDATGHFQLNTANLKYWNDNKYFVSKTPTSEYIISDIKRAAPRPGDEKWSRYPHPSDLILDTEDMTSFGFPEGYVQSFDNPISDHDPVEAVLTSPNV